MSQHDLDIANQTASAARADINLALKALGSTNSGNTEPATTYANMLWYDTSTNTLKIRAEADDAWMSIGYLKQAEDSFNVFDDTKLVNTSGTQVGLLGDQATATWEGGTGTLDSLVSPANVKAAIIALTPPSSASLGEGQSWATASRTSGTSYQNTGGRPIQINVNMTPYFTGVPDNLYYATVLQVSSNNSTWVEVGRSSVGQSGDSGVNSVSPVIPDDYYYRYLSTNSNSTGNATFVILS
jgi:hypothetical protein